MKIILKSVRITDVSSKHNNTSQDICIEDGIIQNIATSINDTEAILVEHPNLHVSQGWVDLKSNFFDPGFEHKETILNGLDTAAAGGFTHVASLSSSTPIADSKAQIEYQLRAAEQHATQLHPIGAITKNQNGEDLAELYDCYLSGAHWFSDDLNTINEGMLYRALLYVKDFGGRIVFFPRSKYLAHHSMVNEGLASVRTGMKGDPNISECIEIKKALFVAEHTQCPIHITGISSAEGVKLIKDAKHAGLNVTADVNLMNLCFNESETLNFDTHFKVMPVLRSETDRLALIQGLKEGSIDAIASDHRPSDVDEKKLDFNAASFGTAQLQTVYAALLNHSSLSSDFIVEQLSIKNRKTLGLEEHPIAIGNKADLCLYSPDKEWIYDESSNQSFSNISPFWGKTIKGFSHGIIHGHQAVLKQS